MKYVTLTLLFFLFLGCNPQVIDKREIISDDSNFDQSQVVSNNQVKEMTNSTTRFEFQCPYGYADIRREIEGKIVCLTDTGYELNPKKTITYAGKKYVLIDQYSHWKAKPLYKKEKPFCRLYGKECGFSYSSGYQNSYRPWGGYLKCQIEYWRPGEDSGSPATLKKIYYTNCGTCFEPANVVVNPKAKDYFSRNYTSVESPTSVLIGQADGKYLQCNTKNLRLNSEYKVGWSFRITTIDDGSTCQANPVWYSYSSANTCR